MDKLITAVIIIAVAVFFAWLYYQDGEGGGAWMATVGVGEQAQSMGPYASYDECSTAVRMAEGVDVNVTPYSCSQAAAAD